MTKFIHTYATALGVATASAVEAKDAMSVRFEIPLAIGVNGGRVENAILIDYASANADMRLHLFHSQPSAYVTGATFVLANADDDKYLGFIDFTVWASAGTSKMVAQSTAPGVAVYGTGGTRSVWGVMEARENLTAGAYDDPFRFGFTIEQDR